MKHNIEYLKYRKHLLEARNPVENANIINKLAREIRKLEGK